jgi:hypothetical protein
MRLCSALILSALLISGATADDKIASVTTNQKVNKSELSTVMNIGSNQFELVTLDTEVGVTYTLKKEGKILTSHTLTEVSSEQYGSFLDDITEAIRSDADVAKYLANPHHEDANSHLSSSMVKKVAAHEAKAYMRDDEISVVAKSGSGKLEKSDKIKSRHEQEGLDLLAASIVQIVERSK